MFRKRLVWVAVVVACLLGLCAGASAAEVESGSTYCFSAGDFSEKEGLVGICITALPDESSGTVLLGSRVLRPGDILTVGQIEQMTFAPLNTETDLEAVVTFLPIYEDRVEKNAVMTISIRGKTDKAPVAEDSALETYKNLPNEGLLKVEDPEGKTLTFTVTRQPKRGEVVIRSDGSFLYTPKKNKVGTDSFVYTATDPAGNVSREATVTVTILKPDNELQYADTAGSACRFEAEWMKNTGLFVGEQVGGSLCFGENKPVSRGEFLTMLVELLDIPVDKTTGGPDWMQPYLDAAIRSGLVTGWQQESFAMTEAITGAEAAVVLQNTLDLPVGHEEVSYAEEAPVWAAASLAVMAANGLELDHTATLTRGETAQLLYQVSRMAVGAPGMTVFSAHA